MAPAGRIRPGTHGCAHSEDRPRTAATSRRMSFIKNPPAAERVRPEGGPGIVSARKLVLGVNTPQHLGWPRVIRCPSEPYVPYARKSSAHERLRDRSHAGPPGARDSGED